VSEKLPRLTAKELIRVPERKGWEHDRSRGSHHIYVYPATRRTLSVPVAKRPMSIGTRGLPGTGSERAEQRRRFAQEHRETLRRLGK
jgi:predicted RNA binding protein YcfA (HicA-like mRNA interferase family)